MAQQGRSRRTAESGRPRAARRRPDQIAGGLHGLSDDEVAASQRARLLAAMTAAVHDHGYAGASIADVIARAGVSRKTFYEHFEDKETCFVAVYEGAIERLLAIARRSAATQDDWADSLRAGLTALLDALAYDPPTARLCFVDVLAAGPKAAARRNAAMAELTGILAPGPDQVDPALPASLGLTVIGGLGEILYQRIVGGSVETLPDLAPELMYALVLPFLGTEAAARELERSPAKGPAAPS